MDFYDDKLNYLSDKEKKFILEVKNEIRNRIGDNFIDFILFGSKARGDYYDSSDIDIMVVVTSKICEIIIDDILYELQIKYDIFNISLLVYVNSEYEKQKLNPINLFFKSVMREGIHV